MADNLKITTPISTPDTSAKLRPNREAQVINPADPTRVTNKDNQNQSETNNGLKFLLNQKSVFQRFINQLQGTPMLSQSLQKVMLDIFLRTGSLNFGSQISELNKQVAEKIIMEPDEIVKNLMFQQSNETKFSSGVFELLRQIPKSSNSSDFEAVLGRFLKAYDNYLSGSSSLKACVSNLKYITTLIPKSYANQLSSLIDDVVVMQKSGDTKRALDILKNNIIPFLGEYVTKTNDFGKSRDIITLLVSNIAKLNTSSRENLLSAFESLVDYCRYNLNMNQKEIDNLQGNFIKDVTFADKKNNEVFDAMIDLISNGLKEKSSATSQTIYAEALNTLLLSKNVFMPLQHIFLPINLYDNYIFTEIWIDKNAENSDGKTTDYEKTTKLFITFDINKVGYFEAIVTLSENTTNKSRKVALKLNYPQTLEEHNYDIKSSVEKILQHNGLNEYSVVTSSLGEPSSLNKVFPNIFKRRRAIDVTV